MVKIGITTTKIFKNNKNSKNGFTLLELVVYIGIMLVVSIIVIGFVAQLIKINSYSQITGEVLDNARRGIEIITQEIKHGQSIYSPTSVFDVHPGQLSIETARNVPTDENSTYVDFYIDDQRLYVKKEGITQEIIMSDKIIIDSLIFTHLDDTPQSTSVRIALTISYDTPTQVAKNQSTITLFATASLRSY